jgi:hypothetical protein
MVPASLGGEPKGMNARIRTVRTIGVSNAARLEAAVRFRLRLLKMALRPVGRIPALVVMALESPDYEASVLLDPDRSSAGIGSVQKPASRPTSTAWISQTGGVAAGRG